MLAGCDRRYGTRLLCCLKIPMLMCIPCSIFHLHTWHQQAGRLLQRSRFFIGWFSLLSFIAGCFLYVTLALSAYSFVNDPLLWPLYITYPFIGVWLLYNCMELNKCWCCCCKYKTSPPRPQFTWMSPHWASVYLHEHLASIRPNSKKGSILVKNKPQLNNAACPLCWYYFKVPLKVPRQADCHPGCTDAEHHVDCKNSMNNVGDAGVGGVF